MEIVANTVVVSRHLIEARSVLMAGGYSEEDADKTVLATGFETLSRFDNPDLGEFVARNIQVFRESLPKNPSDVKLILVVTQTNLRRIPNAASILQEKLGLSETVLCLEIVDGCNGFVKALHISDRILKKNQTGLIFAGEMNSIMLSRAPASTSVLFGDGFALTQVIKKGDFSSQILQSGARGEVIRFGGEDKSLHMDGYGVFAFTTQEVPKLFTNQLSETFGPRKFPVFHQASKLVVERVAKKIGYFESAGPVFRASRIGNLGAGSIPSWLAQQDSIQKGCEIISVGFGSGLSWGYASAGWNAERNELVYV